MFFGMVRLWPAVDLWCVSLSLPSTLLKTEIDSVFYMPILKVPISEI